MPVLERTIAVRPLGVSASTLKPASPATLVKGWKLLPGRGISA
jgi:hypothetical protein